MRPRMTEAMFIALIALLSFGCEGTISGTMSDPDPDPNPNNPTPMETGGHFSCETEGDQSLERPLRRLSQHQISGALERLFGTDLRAAVATSLDGLPAEGQGLNAGSFAQEFNAEFMGAAFRLVDAVGREAASGDALSRYHECEGAIEGECVTQLVERLGLRVLRRPLTAEQVTHYESVFAGAGDNGAEVLVSAMLMNPRFLFHLEAGDSDVTELDQFEVASRISFMVEDSIPDDELLDLAAAGRLEGDTLRSQVERLLHSDRGRDKLFDFFARWLRVRTLPPIESDAAFNADIDPSTFPDESLVELRRFVEHVVYEERGGLLDLILGDEAFPHTEQLAAFFDAPLWEEGTPPSRSTTRSRGLLLRAPRMMSGRNETSPILRGVFMLNEVLCRDLGFPGDEIIDARGDQDIAANAETVREVTASMTSSPECMVCHSSINPIGFALEDVDALGRFRTEELHFSEGEIEATYPVDSQVDGLLLDGVELSVRGSEELMAHMAESGEVAACFARKYFRFSQNRSEDETNADECQMARMFVNLEGTDGSILGLLAEAYSEAVLTTRRVAP